MMRVSYIGAVINMQQAYYSYRPNSSTTLHLG